MTNDGQNQAESIKTYRPWVGVVLSFFIAGASQFLTGEKLLGISWFAGIILFKFIAMFCLASPLAPGNMPAFGLFAAAFALWIIMLVKSYRPIPRFRWIGWICFMVLFLFLSEAVYLGIIVFIRPFNMPSSSMYPTIQGYTKTTGGDHFFVQEFAYWFGRPQRGDIIAFKTAGISTLPQNEIYLKRIVGIPGDVLSIQDGRLFNHDQPVTEPPPLAKLTISNPPVGNQPYLAKMTDTFVVPNNCYFVVGDNTTNSYDSRFWGTLPEKNIIGKVSKIYWPLNHAGTVQ